MSRKVLKDAKKEYPQIYLSLRSRLNVYADPLKAEEIGAYNDFDFQFRRRMVSNIPYLQSVSQEIVQDIICLMRPRMFDAGTTIVKRGDKVDCLMLLKSGEIAVQVPVFASQVRPKKNRSALLSAMSSDGSQAESARFSNINKVSGMDTVYQYGDRIDSIFLDSLNPGSCFCVYSAFTDD